MSFIKSEPQWVAWQTWLWFQTFDEWPLPIELHHHIARVTDYPLEHAEHDVLNALNAEVVVGVPSIVLMRQGEAFGNWNEPLPPSDSGFRIVMGDKQQGSARKVQLDTRDLVA